MATTPRSFPSSGINDPYGSRDTGLDDTIESSFPASDPPSTIPDPPSDSTARDAADGASRTVGRLARSIERQAARLPSDPFLWAAIGSLGVSAALQVSGKRQASLFAGQLAPVFLLLGLYNRLAEQFGSDRYDPA